MRPDKDLHMLPAARLLARCTIAVFALTFVTTTWPSAAAPMYGPWSEPANLGPDVNSPANDMAPAMSKNGLSLYFQSNRTGGRPDLWVSQRADLEAPWEAPINLGLPINSDFTEGGPAFSRDGHWLFFNSDRPGGVGGTDIWASWRAHTHDDFGWEPPVNLAAINTASGESTGSYFENDDVGMPLLFFSSNRPGLGPAPGGPYVSAMLVDGTYGPPALVADLDSPGDDMRPMIRFDGREILLASSRAGSLGRDLWASVRDSVFDAWEPPIKLASVVNSAANELTPFLSANGRTLIFASDRVNPNSMGGLDLYFSTRERRNGKTP
jgi:hypothetical protein